LGSTETTAPVTERPLKVFSISGAATVALRSWAAAKPAATQAITMRSNSKRP
jgi:hypothetical protein